MAMNGKHNFTELAKAMTFRACSSKKSNYYFILAYHNLTIMLLNTYLHRTIKKQITSLLQTTLPDDFVNFSC